MFVKIRMSMYESHPPEDHKLLYDKLTGVEESWERFKNDVKNSPEDMPVLTAHLEDLFLRAMDFQEMLFPREDKLPVDDTDREVAALYVRHWSSQEFHRPAFRHLRTELMLSLAKTILEGILSSKRREWRLAYTDDVEDIMSMPLDEAERLVREDEERFRAN